MITPEVPWPSSKQSPLAKRFRRTFTFLFLLAPGLLQAAPQLALVDAWTPANEELDGNLANGPEPHFVYAIGVTWNDTVLVASEGRFSHDPANPDTGEKYLLVKRSVDHGATWSGDIIVEGGDGASWTNPALVSDGVTTYLFYGTNKTGTKTLHYKTSVDNGQTWSARQDINALWGSSFPNGWVQHGTIGHGIKKLKDPNRGRLLLAFGHRTSVSSPAADAKYGVDFIYHDPNGAWARAQGVQPPLAQESDSDSTNDIGPNESRVAERANGTLVLISRKRWNTTTYTRSRVSGSSITNGVNWNSWADAAGIEGTRMVDGGFIRFSDTCHLYSFSNNPGSATRLNMAIKASTDGGVTWSPAQTLYTGPATYSDLVRDSLGNIFCVFGRDGDNHNIDLDPSSPKARVTVARFNLEWVTATNTPTIVVDNVDSGFSTTGTWGASSTVAGYYGAGYTHATSLSDTATWTPTVTVPGSYEVFIRWTSGSNRPAAVPVEIKYNGGSSTATATINQQTEGGVWYYLGNYNLSAGSGNNVKILAVGGISTIADAVMFQKL